MNPLRDVRPPGVYPASGEVAIPSIAAAETGVAGFVGLAVRGPLDEPVRIGSWGAFVETFGEWRGSYLTRGVEGFFANGGHTCYVVRVAHRAKSGAPTGPTHAVASSLEIADGWGKPTLRVRAESEGRWGDQVWVRFEQSTSATALLTLDLEIGAGAARVSSTKGFERGALVRIYDREQSAFVVLTDTDQHTLRWGLSTPVAHRFRAAGPTHFEVVEFHLHASLKERREVFHGLQLSPLSRRYAARWVNEQSRLVRIDDLQSTSPAPFSLPIAGPAAKLVGGADGVEAVTAEDFVGYDHGPAERRGLEALGAIEEIGLLAVPDAMVFFSRHSGPQAERDLHRVQSAMVDQCERLQDRFALLDAPPYRDVDEVRRWRRRFDSTYAGLYYPWLTVEDVRSGAAQPIPPSGHVAGVFARCDALYGSHKAPANEVIADASGVALALQDDHIGLLHGEGINPLRVMPGRGVRIWGARTATEDPSWKFINVRRLFILLRRSIAVGTQWAAFEPNHPSTWALVGRLVSLFLEQQWKRGALVGASPSEAYFVKCDEETNPPVGRDRGQLVIEIGVAPTLPAEFIIFQVTQKMGDQAPDPTAGPSRELARSAGHGEEQPA